MSARAYDSNQNDYGWGERGVICIYRYVYHDRAVVDFGIFSPVSPCSLPPPPPILALAVSVRLPVIC
jgi:hypothetical protein